MLKASNKHCDKQCHPSNADKTRQDHSHKNRLTLDPLSYVSNAHEAGNKNG